MLPAFVESSSVLSSTHIGRPTRIKVQVSNATLIYPAIPVSVHHIGTPTTRNINRNLVTADAAAMATSVHIHATSYCLTNPLPDTDLLFRLLRKTIPVVLEGPAAAMELAKIP